MTIVLLVDQLKDLVSDPLYIGLVRVLGQDLSMRITWTKTSLGAV